MKHIGFPSIRQYTDVVRYVGERMQYAGKDEHGKDLFHRHTVPKPKLMFRGTVKWHGANAAVVLNVKTGEIHYQSKDHVLTLEKDLFGFMFYMESKTDQMRQIFDVLLRKQTELPEYIAVFGEWCGGAVQRRTTLSVLPKMFVMFAAKIVTGEHIDGSSSGHWADIAGLIDHDFPDDLIFNTLRFGSWNMEIDFERPKMFQNDLVDASMAVEASCPGAKYFGIDGIGEGIVWNCVEEGWDPYQFGFKVKGEKHSATKVKKLASVDVEVVKAIEDFVEMACTEARLEQGLHHLRYIDHKPFELTSMGDFIRWVYTDIIKEESETIAANGLDVKKLGVPIALKSRYWFFAKMEAEKETPET